MAAAWKRTGRFTWRDAAGHLLYASGVAASGKLDPISAPLSFGTLFVSEADASLQPMLATHARLLQAAIERENEIELLTDELMRTTDQLVALFEMSAAARTGQGTDKVMRTCVEQAARLTGAEYAVLVIRGAARDSDAPTAVSFPPADGSGSADALLSVLERGRHAGIANSPDDCAALCGRTIGGIVRMVVAPLSIGGEPDAILGAINKADDFISGDLKLIIALADAAAVFLEREQNYQRELNRARVRRELEIAAEIQRGLLPRDVPTLPGVQIAALSKAAGEVGGDFFDVQTLPDGVLAVALGDTAGKGVPAALFMAMARVLLRVGLQTTRSPGDALKLLNAGLAGDLANADLFLTLFAATFDPASGELRAINCGQSPVLVFHAGTVTEWEADGPPIGVLPDLVSVERRRRLEPGDALVVLSDGFNEARDAGGRRIGIGPLIETVLRASGGNASAIADALLRSVETFERGLASSDDQTLIVLKVE